MAYEYIYIYIYTRCNCLYASHEDRTRKRSNEGSSEIAASPLRRRKQSNCDQNRVPKARQRSRKWTPKVVQATEKSTKNRRNFAFGCSRALSARFWLLRVTPGMRRDPTGRPQDAKLASLGCQVGRLGRHVGHLGRQVDGLGRPKSRRGASGSALRTRS